METKTNLWQTRYQALVALDSNLKAIADIIEEAFSCLDECIDRAEALDSEYGRVCGLTLVKARNLALGMYSLTLDGLAQEGGALLRPLIGVIEKLVYFRQDPAHIEQAITESLPPEGKISKMIDGDFKDLRDYLSKHAAHSEFSEESIKHLIDYRAFRLKKVQPFNEIVLRKNLEMVFSFLVFIVFEGQKCLAFAGSFDEALANRIEAMRESGKVIAVD
jgi:hypothetical protein